MPISNNHSFLSKLRKIINNKVKSLTRKIQQSPPLHNITYRTLYIYFPVVMLQPYNITFDGISSPFFHQENKECSMVCT